MIQMLKGQTLVDTINFLNITNVISEQSSFPFSTTTPIINKIISGHLHSVQVINVQPLNVE